MKILIATDFYKNNLGGVTSSVFALCKGLHYYRHEVKVLTMSSDTKSHHENDEYLLGSLPAFYAPGMRFSLRTYDPLIEELINWRPDIIHVQSEGSALFMARKIQKECNIPLIMTAHTDYAYFVFKQMKDDPLIKKFTALIGKIIYAPAYKIIVPSSKALGFSFLKPYKDRLIVVSNGIELEKYQKSLTDSEKKELRKTLGISENNKILCAITRLSKEKNIEELITYLPDLLKKTPDVTLMIVGEGPYRRHLQKLVERLDLQNNVVFTGQIPFEEIWRYLDLSDVFVSASLFEVHSMSYLEALSQGLPLLCRNDEALKGVLEHKVNGYIYNTRKEFIDYALNILNDDELRKKFGSNSLEKAADFSCIKTAQKMIGIYEDTISEYQTVISI